ncbi:hypothetical protein J3R30DRAFT_3304347, partial [Lentinula aciculospora]
YEFLSPVTHKQTHKYSGSSENRIQVVLEDVGAVRAVIPYTMDLVLRPVFVNTFAKMIQWIREHGVDVLDASGGQSAA